MIGFGFRPRIVVRTCSEFSYASDCRGTFHGQLARGHRKYPGGFARDENIVVISGASPPEKKFWLGEFRRELKKVPNRVAFTWFNELSFEEIQKRAAALTSSITVKLRQ